MTLTNLLLFNLVIHLVRESDLNCLEKLCLNDLFFPGADNTNKNNQSMDLQFVSDQIIEHFLHVDIIFSFVNVKVYFILKLIPHNCA